jgi:hypothetical protein
LPALDRILGAIPPLLQAFQPFLRNADPIVRYIGLFKPEITGLFGNVTAASQAYYNQTVFAPGQAVHYVRASQTMSPAGLAFYPRPLGINRDNAYRAPGSFGQLASGLSTLDTAACANGNPAPPTSATGSIPIQAANPPTIPQLIEQYVFRTSGRNVAAPSCRAAGTIPGYSTSFPHLTADPPPGLSGGSGGG